MTLKADITSDLSTFLNSDEFAVVYTYNGNPFNGIFTDAYKGINLATDEIESTDPQIEVNQNNVVGIGHGDTMTINSIVYYVTGIHPDGTGMVILMLSRDAP